MGGIVIPGDTANDGPELSRAEIQTNGDRSMDASRAIVDRPGHTRGM